MVVVQVSFDFVSEDTLHGVTCSPLSVVALRKGTQNIAYCVTFTFV
jgi:hypothetical protein